MTKHHKAQIALFIVYILVVSGIMIWQGIGIDPSRYIFVLLIPAFFFHKTRAFLLDWIPFLFIFLSYEFLRGLTPFVNPRANYTLAINFDKAVFGQIPTISLQQALFNPSHLTLIDYLSSFFYSVHLALPFVFGYILWIYNRANFRRFSLGIILLSYAGWLTFVIFPAAPPWLASRVGLLPYVYRVSDFTSASFPDKFHLPSIYHDFYPNNVAAVPSMHAAYPLLVLLYGLKFFKSKFLAFSIYVLAVWFALVYLGEHYIFDELTGAIYALVAFFLSEWVYKNRLKIEKGLVRFLPFMRPLLAPGNKLS